MGKILTVKGISKNYKIGNTQVHALKSTTLDINKGEIVVVIGKSGSGKSTFLNILGGLIVPDSGEVLLDGKNLYKLGEKERAKIRNQKCGFIYQSFNLINELSVINNIRLPFDIAGKPYDTKRERELLAILDLEKRKHFYPSQLSGGERQRTAVARALLRLSLSTYTLYRINGLTFGKLIRSLLLQLLAVYSVGIVLSVPMTWLLIKNGFNILNSITYYFSPLNFLSVILSVFVLMFVSFIPSLILLYKRKNNILLD